MPSEPLSELQAQVGRSVRAVEGLTVEAGKVTEFVHALGGDVDAYARTDGRELLAPLTFTRTAYFPRYRPPGIDADLGFDLGFHPEYTVHGEQAYEYERPVAVGDELSADTTLTDVYQREGGRGGTLTFAVYETTFREPSGEAVCTERQTRIETEGAIDDGEQDTRSDGASPSSAGPVDTTGDRAAGTPPVDDLDVRELSVGDDGPSLVVPDVNRTDFVRYAGASGDFHPIHYDEPYAVAADNPSVFGQGMLTAGYAARLVSHWLGVDAVDAFGGRFRSRLWPGDTVVVQTSVSGLADKGDARVVELDLEVGTDDERLLFQGTADATVELE